MDSNAVVSTVRGLQLSMRYEGGRGGGRTAVVGRVFQFHDRMGRRKGFFRLKLSQLVEGYE